MIVLERKPAVMTIAGDAIRFREWMFSLTQRCTRRGISLMMIVEVPELCELGGSLSKACRTSPTT